MGASLLAKAVVQSPWMLNGRPHSRASSLPQDLCETKNPGTASLQAGIFSVQWRITRLRVHRDAPGHARSIRTRP
ncbi:hypothetical protein DMX02_10770 [Pseudomonas jessenii]|nr:hypothetical protein DMX02_10770 [Pseudomonas jessenii]